MIKDMGDKAFIGLSVEYPKRSLALGIGTNKPRLYDLPRIVYRRYLVATFQPWLAFMDKIV